MSVLDPRELEASPLSDLHALASELGLEGFRRLRKDDLIKQIVEAQGGTVESNGADDAGDSDPETALYEDAAAEPEGAEGDFRSPGAPEDGCETPDARSSINAREAQRPCVARTARLGGRRRACAF